jgi:K+-transporting ATPase ATPase C chain
MCSWKHSLRPALAALVFLSVLTGIVYPAAVWAGAWVLFPFQASGSLVRDHGRLVGSQRIAQDASDSGSFHSRPSAAGSGYVADSSSGSNVGPLSRSYVDTVIPGRMAAYRNENGLPLSVPVPADAVTASGSGLDPDITLANALLQVPRVARVHHLNPNVLAAYVRSQAQDGIWYAERERPVNVLALNLALRDGRIRLRLSSVSAGCAGATVRGNRWRTPRHGR